MMHLEPLTSLSCCGPILVVVAVVVHMCAMEVGALGWLLWSCGGCNARLVLARVPVVVARWYGWLGS